MNRIPGDEFQSGEAGFIEHIRMHYPGVLREVVDQRMEMTENAYDQATQAIGLGLMCTDQTSTQQLNLGQISDMITQAYESWQVFESPPHKRPHGDRGKGHKRTQ